MNKNLSTLVGPFLALALLAAACGGSDEAADSDQAVIEALAAQLESEDDVPPGVDTNCFATALVEGLGGADTMASEYGVTVETLNAGEDPSEIELPLDQAREVADGLLGCDFRDVIVNEMVGSGIDASAGECLADAIDDDIFRDLIASGFVSDADAVALEESASGDLIGVMFEAFAGCDIDPAALGG